MACLFILSIIIGTFIERTTCDTFIVQSLSPTVSSTSNYQFTLSFDNDITPPVGSTIAITFPAQYQSRLTASSYACTIEYWPSNTAPSPSCAISNSILTISSLFTTLTTYTAGYPFLFDVVGIMNPYSTQKTGSFTLSMTLDSGSYSAIADGVTCSIGLMACTVATLPTQTNQDGSLIISFVAPQFPSGSTLGLQSNVYWPEAQPPEQQGSQIIQSTNLVCKPITNSISGISCSYQMISGIYQITVTNIAASTLNSSTISFSLATILSPPTTKPQGSFQITSYLNNSAMTKCTGVSISSTTAGALTGGSFSTSSITVNAIGVGTLTFGIKSDIIETDSFAITFPSTIGLGNLNSVYINNGGSTSSPTISGQSLTLTNAKAYKGDTISITFTNVVIPPSEQTTKAFQITTIRNGYSIQTSSSITFSAYRSLITTASLSSSSLQIGVSSTYTITFTLGQPLISTSAIVIGLPSSLQGKVGGCLPLPCSILTTTVIFTSVSMAVGTSVTLTLTSVTNPYTLGLTTSLTLYTLYNSTLSSSTVEYVNTGLTLMLTARASTSSKAVIFPSSYVVTNYPTTYNITITNLNPFPAYTYLVLYLPPQISTQGQIICQSGAFVVSCTYNSSSNLLTFSAFASSLTAGQLSSSTFYLQNLINPASTMPTSSFQVYFYNSNNQLIEYIAAGLSQQMTTAASFSALSLVPNSTVNSAATSLSVSFNVPSSVYQNNSLLVLTFPSVISLSSMTCTIISSNILAINTCSVYSNTVKILISFSSLSTFTTTKLSVGTYSNYPSLQSYTIQVDLYGDTYGQSKLCSNTNSLTILYNNQLGAIGVSSFSFSNPTLLSNSNLDINIANVSSSSFSSLTIKFPPDFSLMSAGCSVPAGISCSSSSGNIFNLTTASTFSLPFSITITNLITTAYTPSSYIYLQTFSSTGYQMDSNQNIAFTTTCTLPCKTCQSASQSSICTSCYSNSSLNQVGGAIYLNGSLCSSFCSSGYYLDNSTQNCLQCSTSCLTCIAFTTCLTCNGSFLYNSSCLSSCPFSFYGFNFQCFSCPTSIFCQSCSDNYHCSSCIVGYYYYNQQCSLSCPTLITYPNSVNRTCDNCPQNCTNCAGNSTQVTCTICNSGYVLDNTGCQLSCITAGTFAVNGICQGCSSNCQTCSVSYLNCTSCYSNTSNPFLYNNNCISICPNGYYADNSSFSCLKCTSPCEYCLNSSIHSCQTCLTGYFFYNNNCLATCPANYYNTSGSCLACVSPCFTCTAELTCLSCTNNTYLYQSQCLAQCPSSMAIINGNQCLVCLSSCKTCATLTACTSCFNNSYLYNGTCLNICPTTTYANSTDGFCDSCVSPCLACSSLNTCTSCADSTKFLVNGSCIACNSPCLSCSLSISNCTSCITTSATPYYLNYNCLTICPSNYYTDNGTFSCTVCAYPCLTCSGITNSSCSSCAMGYYFLLNFCYATCPTTYFNNISICSSCTSPCLACTGTTICISCVSSYYLSGSTCVNSCGTGMAVINNSVCAFCEASCQTCLSSNNSACTSCYSTQYLLNSACGTICPNTYYADSSSNKCLSCLSPCLNCQSTTICLSCLDSTLFLVNGSCLSCASPCLTCSGLRTNCTSCDISSSYPYLSSGNCISSCPATYYGSISYSCVQCTSPCNSCQNSSSTYCLTCLSNYYQLGNVCYTNCPTGYFPNITICSACTSPCSTCADASTCLSCISNYFLLGSTCVTNCSVGMAIINGNTCQYCNSSCQTCSSSNSSSCTSCYSGAYLYSTTCQTTCPNTFYADSNSSKCLACVGGCNTCQSSTFCLSCLDTTLFLVSGSCVGCTSPCVTCNGSVTSCTSCSVSTGYPYLLNNTCVNNCPLTYFNQITLDSCVKCTSPCQSCTSASTSSCLSCINGYLILSGYCITSCPPGYYSNTTACLTCSSPCQNCYDSLACTSCVNGYYLLGSNCVTNCSTGMILINNTYCQYCTGLCITCLTSNSSFCTSCSPTQFLQWGNCVNTCSSGYYGNSTSGLCIICSSPCSTCLSSVLCLSCQDSTLFLLNNACVACISPCLTCSITRNNCTSCDQSSSYPLLVNNICLDSCPTGYYASLFTCYRCNSPCDTCLNVSNTTCLTCVNGYVMFGSSCVINCPSGYYSNSISCSLCANNCSTCTSNSVCLTCSTGLYLLGTSCVSLCPNGTIGNTNSSGGICSYCNSPCTSCQTLNISYCTSCPSYSYLLNGQCLSNCSSGYYQNTVLWICSLCVSPCSSCISPTQCLSCLDPNNFLMSFSCIGCSSTCLTCSLSISNCTSCNKTGEYPYYYSNTCLTGCPTTYYNDSSFMCLPCASPCYTCTGSGNQTCTTCFLGYYQLNSVCYTNCPNGYYNLVNQCLGCSSPCGSCTSSSNNSCTSCLSGLFLLGSSCVSNCSGLSVSGSTCLYCSSSCNTCLTNNNNYCTTCTTGLYLYNGGCISNCSTGYYADSTALACMICINNCNTCTSATACLSCKDSTLFLINSQCVSCSSNCLTCSITINNCTSCNVTSSYPILFSFSCLNSCPSSYFNNTPSSCTQCSSPCSTCSSQGTFCLSCLTGYYFLLNACYSTCPQTYFQNVSICSVCDTSCYTCRDSATTCIICQSGLYLRGSSCVSQCQSGQILINNTYCQVCSSTCLTCLSSNYSYCTSCSNGLLQLGGLCYSTCPTQYYGNSTSSTCLSCKLPCATCNSDTLCLSCNPATLFLVNYTCASCTSPCLTCQNLQTNCTSCSTGSAYPFLFNSNCLSSCPSTYYNDGSFNCLKCNSPCDTCTSSSNSSCLTCLPGYSQLGTYCYLNCPLTYYSNGTFCLGCNMALCKTCMTTNDTCLSCASGLYLYGSTCTASCPTGMIIYNGSICQSCSGSCLTCLSSNNSYCTSCFPNSFLYMGTCIATCPNNFFADSSSGDCKSCQSPCQLCSSVSSCLSCASSLFYLQNSTCVSSCSYPLIGINSVCYQCSSQCLTCIQNISTCLLCAIGFYYFPLSYSCSLYCSHYILRANQSTSGNNECTQTCPTGTFTDSSSQYCQNCPTGCKACTSLTNCSQCTSSYSYYLNFCYSPCPSYAPYSVNSTCIVCNISSCLSCQNTTYCSSCQSSYLLIAQGISSTCIQSCPSGFVYNNSTLACIVSVANTTLSAANVVVSSAIPSYTFMITSAALLFVSFILKFKYSDTNLSLIIFVSLIITTACCLGNLLYIQIYNSGILLGSFSQISVSTYLLLSSAAIQAISSLASFLFIIKLRDSGLIRQFHAFPIAISSIMMLSLLDSNILFLTISHILSLDCFKIKYTSLSMITVLKCSLAISVITKIVNIVYSGIQLNFYNANAHRLLISTADYPVNNAYTTEFIILSSLTIAVVLYLLYNMSLEQKVENSKNESNQSLIDDAIAFDKRNSSNAELIFEVESSDLVVNMNSLREENEIPFASETKRVRTKKVTPDEMLEKMNNGIEEQDERDLTEENVNKQQKLQNKMLKNEENDNEVDLQDINNVFYFEQEDTKEVNNQQSIENKQNAEQQNEVLDKTLKDKVHLSEKDNQEEPNLNQTPQISQIIYNDQMQSPYEPSNLLQNQIQVLQQAMNEKTKTEVINIFSMDNNTIIKEQDEKHSPSQLSKYQPNRHIQQQFANSYLDDANKFNEHNEEMKQSAQFVNFQVDNKDYNQLGSLEEISFQPKEDFATIQEPQLPKQEQEVFEDHIFKKNEWGQRDLEKELEDIIQVPIYQPQIIKIEEEESFREYQMEQKMTPSKNTFFQEQEQYNQYKPSEGFKGKARRSKNKPEIPLPKNEMEKDIMSIYQKKEKDKKEPSSKKKRYPDLPNQTKQSNYVQYSIEDKDFIEQKGQSKPIFSGQIKKDFNRYNQSRSSNKFLPDDEQTPQKPSLKLRKSSFKKIGQMVLDQSQSSARKQ